MGLHQRPMPWLARDPRDGQYFRLNVRNRRPVLPRRSAIRFTKLEATWQP